MPSRIRPIHGAAAKEHELTTAVLFSFQAVHFPRRIDVPPAMKGFCHPAQRRASHDGYP